MPRSFLLSFSLLLLVGCGNGDVYFPPICEDRCTEHLFIRKLPEDTGPVDRSHNRAYAWAVMALIQTKANFEVISPPAAGRICAIVGACLYEAAALNRKDYKSNVRRAFKFREHLDDDAIAYAMDGAGFWALRRLFGDRPSFDLVFEQYTAFSGLEIGHMEHSMEDAVHLSTNVLARQILSHPLHREDAMRAGAAACQRVVSKYTDDGFTARGGLDHTPDPTNYHSRNLPQSIAGITNCPDEIRDFNRWQPLCVPHGSHGFGTTQCEAQTFIYPWAGRYATYALHEGDETSGKELVGEPPNVGTEEYRRQWEEILSISAELGDVEKVIAEYWADGPDSTLPAGHFWKIAADAALFEGMDPTETARLLFIVGNALYDAGIAAWRTKTSYDYARPLQMIQCSEYGDHLRSAWMGPYMGTGLVNMSEWRPYQAETFVTPGFSGYVSGHSTFSAAASEAMRLFFGNDTYKGPCCDRVREGESLFEPLSHVFPGTSDRPNTGPGTPGYVPAEDVILCWGTFKEASDQAGYSRFYGGIHIEADDTAGQQLGRYVGRIVYEKASELYKVSYE